MKKIFIVITLLLSLTMCLQACNGKENPEFTKFNEMFEGSFENYKITISSTSTNGNTTNNEYMVTTLNGERRVSYKIETLNKFDVSGNTIEIPESYKTFEQGTYNQELSASSSFDIPKFDFSNEFLKNYGISTTGFNAQITSLKDFMGLDVNTTNAKFKLDYSGNYPNSIEISYVTDEQVTVVLTYTFY